MAISPRGLPHQRSADEAVLALEQEYGLSRACQQKLGAFMTYMGMFERLIEVAAWAILEEGVTGKRPSTDKIGISDIIGRIKKRARGRDGALGDAINLTCECADDLLAYRNAIAHGWLFPSTQDAPYFMSNVSFHGEHRARAFQDAHISENLLDLAIDAAVVLVTSARGIFLSCSGPNAFCEDQMAHAIDRLTRARSEANELRNLRALMGADKY
ncbi:hypothetical protein QDD82_001433 [Burkholderia cepacia]|uniref:hypothetical protein n=1 Tax=Burkholderia TaxID=32008 RepID=UPI00128E698B|nr:MULTISPECIES: hypothetical protein [Burkholderia]EKS9840643.1 hypothetical protein [Burkholderia cepacia]MPV69416.1 hypothetical protein [Burkholderia sp. BE17]